MAKQEKENKKQKHFWKDFKAELKKVIWPTKKQLANSTLVVIAMVLITTIVVLVLDLTFEALNTYGINKIKKAVQDSISTTEDNQEEHSHENDESSLNNEATNNEATAEGNENTPVEE